MEDSKEEGKQDYIEADRGENHTSGTKVPKMDLSFNNSQDSKTGKSKPPGQSKTQNESNNQSNTLSMKKLFAQSTERSRKAEKKEMPVISLLELKSKVLTNIYSEDWSQVKKELDKCKEKDVKTGNYELFMGFILSVHLEKQDMCENLYNYSDVLKKQITKVFNLYKEMFDEHSQFDENVSQNQRRGDEDRSVISDNIFRKGKLNDTTLFEFKNQDSINIKTILKHKAGEKFGNNSLVICLMSDEEKLASVILIEYPVEINEDIINRAVQREMFKLLYYMWLHNKNFAIINEKDKKIITFNELFQKIQKNGSDKATTRIKEVTDWCLHPENESMLRALLLNNIDSVAGGGASEYHNDANYDLLQLAIENENVVFLKYALQESIFDQKLLIEARVIESILDKMEKGYNIELCLNVLLFSNHSKWKKNLNNKIIYIIQHILHDSDDTNIILLTSNTLLGLAHFQELLTIISINVKKLKRKGLQIIQRLEVLTQKLLENIEGDKVEHYYLDRDFKNRTLLKIATHYKFSAFLLSDKTTILLDSIWQGVNVTECDGRFDDFSLMTFLIKNKTHYIPGKKTNYLDLITNHFEANYENIKFWFQYEFRRESVQYNYLKEFIGALGILIAFQYINFKYLSLFKRTNFEYLPTDAEQRTYIQDKIDEYNGYNFIGTIFSLTLLYSGFTRLLFNRLSKETIPYDLWIVIDVITGLVALIGFNYTGGITVDQVLDQLDKQKVDYYVAAVIIISWVRFFAYFLVIRSVSKLLMTLMYMMKDTISFLLIIIGYLIMMSTVFTTLFQSADPEKYGSMSDSFRTLFDYMLQNYNRETLPSSNNSHVILQIIHIVISSVFLMNFLIAILATVFSVMKTQGEFEYKSHKYSYIEKYQIARLDKKGLDELVIYPAPINMFTLFLLPFSGRQGSEKYADTFSKTMYWVENLIILCLFLCYVAAIIPVIFLRMLLHLLQGTKFYKFPIVFISWLVIGGLALPLYALNDAFCFIKICGDYGDFEKHDDLIKQVEKDKKIVLLDEVTDIMRLLFSEVKKFRIQMKKKLRKNNQANIPVNMNKTGMKFNQKYNQLNEFEEELTNDK